MATPVSCELSVSRVSSPAGRLMLFVAIALQAPSSRAELRPHIVIVLADDVGWSNVGWNNENGEIRTPTLDALAREGVRLDRHYAHWTCSPSRAALLSGRLPAHVNDKLQPPTIHNRADPVGGFQGIPRNMTALGDVLRRAGYRTAVVGKWDAGMATPEHTPRGRGFERGLVYFHHGNDYFSYHGGVCQLSLEMRGRGGRPQLIDLWATDELLRAEGPASVPPRPERQYEEDLFTAEAVAIIESHPAGGRSLLPPRLTPGARTSAPSLHPRRPPRAPADGTPPLFLLYSSHLVHLPHQLPEGVAVPFARIRQPARRATTVMMALLDRAVSRIRAALRARRMWERTLLVFVSDNGGHTTSGGNNWPLRGGKFSPLEGGVRVPAFVSGGALPAHARGLRSGAYVHMADWYLTLAALGGAPPRVVRGDARARAAGLPPVDSIDVWSSITASPPLAHGGARTEIYGGARFGGFLLRGAYKLIVARKVRFANDVGAAVFPADVPPTPKPRLPKLNCSRGCLFDVLADEGERVNLAGAPAHQATHRAMLSRVMELERDEYEPDRGGEQPGACVHALYVYNGTWGPWIDTGISMSYLELARRRRRT